MRTDIWNKLTLLIAAVIGLSIATSATVIAQDNFREFDQKLVATPAEVFELLSMLRSPEQQKQIEAQRQKKLEKAGRDFLSKLSPEQKEEAWKFAEKYLRKNGVDATSSQKLMDQFGLPTDLRNELSEQFRKLGGQSSDRKPNSNSKSGSKENGERDDAITRILQKARDKFKAGSDDKTKNAASPTPPKLGDDPKPDISGGKDNDAELKSKPKRDQELANPGNGNSKQQSSKIPDRLGRQPGGESKNRDQQKRNANKDRENQKDGNANNAWKPPAPRSTKADRDKKLRRSENGDRKKPTSKSESSEAELDQLLARFEELRNNRAKQQKATGGKNSSKTGSNNSFSTENLDWEKVINDLAEKGSTTEGSPLSENGSNENASNPLSDPTNGTMSPAELKRAKRILSKMATVEGVDRSKLLRVKEEISRSAQSQKKNGTNRSQDSAAKKAGSKEQVGTRFDRLLVKAAERTLKSGKDNSSVTSSASSMFGSLIERVQEQALKKQTERQENADRNRNERNEWDQWRNQAEAAKNERNSAESNNANRGSNSSSGSQSNDSFQQPTPESSPPSIDSGNLFDSLPDLSGINPTHIFTFFAGAGLLIFVGYLLAQSVVGSEATISKRKVIQQIRNTKMKSPKDLIETVDVFLLSKFGIKSNWWNTGIVQNVLKSNSPELQSRVDELIQDYIRARYMRDDIQISAADQQRYKNTLEELSSIDIKPAKGFESASTSRSFGSPASAEG